RFTTTLAIGPRCPASTRCACSSTASVTGGPCSAVLVDVAGRVTTPPVPVPPVRPDPPVPPVPPVPPPRGPELDTNPRKASRAPAGVTCPPGRWYSPGMSWPPRAARRTITPAIGPTCLASTASTLASTAGSQLVGADSVPVLVGGAPAIWLWRV